MNYVVYAVCMCVWGLGPSKPGPLWEIGGMNLLCEHGEDTSDRGVGEGTFL